MEYQLHIRPPVSLGFNSGPISHLPANVGWRPTNFTCGYCNFTAPGIQCVSAHILTAHSQRFPCRDCGLEFKSHSDFQRHRKIHENEVEEISYRSKLFSSQDLGTPSEVNRTSEVEFNHTNSENAGDSQARAVSRSPGLKSSKIVMKVFPGDYPFKYGPQGGDLCTRLPIVNNSNPLTCLRPCAWNCRGCAYAKLTPEERLNLELLRWHSFWDHALRSCFCCKTIFATEDDFYSHLLGFSSTL